MAAKRDPTPKTRRSALRRVLAARAAANDAVARPRRKNFELDQRRIDLVKAALGARTETEAITLAMDAALDLVEFRAELRAGAERLYGKGGFVNYFDREEDLDFSGFLPQQQSRRTRRPGRKRRAVGE